MIGSPTRLHPRAGSTDLHFADGTTLTVPYTPDQQRLPEAGRCNILGGCDGGHRPSTTSAVRVTYTHPWVTPLRTSRRRAGGLTFDRIERHADGADPVRLPRLPGPRHPERPSAGQALVEFAMIVPLFMLLLLGLLEFGFVFDHAMTVELRHPRGRPQRRGVRQRERDDDGLHDQRGRRQEHHRRRPARPEGAGLAGRRRPDRARSGSTRPSPTAPRTATKANVWTYSAGGGPTVDGAASTSSRARSTGTPARRDNELDARLDRRRPSATTTRSSPRWRRSWASSGRHGSGGHPDPDRTVMALNPTD